MLKFYLKYLGCVTVFYHILSLARIISTKQLVLFVLCVCFLLHSSYQLAHCNQEALHVSRFASWNLMELVRQWALAAAIIRELFFCSTRAIALARCWPSNRLCDNDIAAARIVIMSCFSHSAWIWKFRWESDCQTVSSLVPFHQLLHFEASTLRVEGWTKTVCTMAMRRWRRNGELCFKYFLKSPSPPLFGSFVGQCASQCIWTL